MIKISKSPTADTRTCDYSKVDKVTLLDSSETHIEDVAKGLAFFAGKLVEAAGKHDYDKLSGIDQFHKDFLTGFKETTWFRKHRLINRHHLNYNDGVPSDVNLIDVIEYITDCVMAGMARSGEVSKVEISEEVLKQAFDNTVKMLKEEIKL